MRSPSLSPTLWDSGFTLEASRPLLFPRTPEVTAPTFFRRPPFLPSCLCFAPWRPCVPTLLEVAEGAFLLSLLSACGPTCSPLAPLSCVPHGGAVSMSLLPLFSPLVIPSSYVSSDESPLLPPLNPLLLDALSPWPSLQRSPLSLSILTCFLWTRHPRSSSSAGVTHLVVVLNPVSASPPVLPHVSPFQPPSPILLHPYFCRPLRPLAPPFALLPPAPAADIVRRDKDVGDWTGWVVARRSLAVGSAPRGKIPSRPHVFVGDGISRPLFLHLPHH